MVARTPAASVREANIHNIHSSQHDLYTGVCICVLTSEDCEDWKLVKDRKKKEIFFFFFLLYFGPMFTNACEHCVKTS